MDIPPPKQYKVLLIGDSCEDVYHFGSCERVSPEAPVVVLRESRVESRHGMAHNVLCNLRSFGLDVEFLTNHEVIKKHRYVDKKTKSHLLRVDEGEKSLLEALPMATIRDLKNKKYDALVISDYDKGFVRVETCSALMKNIGNIPVFIDTKKRTLDCFDYEKCIIKLNDFEFSQLAKEPQRSQLIVTLGEGGALYNGRVFKTQPVEVYDVCGAGDIFLASLVFGFLRTRDLKRSIKIANQLAGLSVTKFGTHVLTNEEISEIRF